jgi:hypothetical protein
MGRQMSLLGTEPTETTTRAPAQYTIVRCVCGTRVVIGDGVASVGCPKCRQIVSGLLATR